MLRSTLLAALLLSPPAAAQYRMTAVVQDEYTDVLDLYTPLYREIMTATVDDLDEGGRNEYGYTLVRGATYRFFAVCDDDCSDIDLVVYDGQYNRVTADFGSSDRPVVTFTVPQNAGNTRYTVAVRMAACDYDPCQFAVGHLRR